MKLHNSGLCDCCGETGAVEHHLPPPPLQGGDNVPQLPWWLRPWSKGRPILAHNLAERGQFFTIISPPDPAVNL